MRLLFSMAVVLAMSDSAPASELKIGLIPEQNVFRQMERYEPIGAYVEKTTGLKIRFTILSRYGNIIESFSREGMDGAFWGSFTGALAIKAGGVEPIARPLWLDGTSHYHGHLFVRKDSQIRTVEDMRGKVMAFVEKATTAGYVFPMAYLKQHGVTDIGAYFKEYYFAGSHDAAIEAVLEGKADIGCAKNTILELLAARDPRVGGELVTLAESSKVPSNGLGIRKDLPPATRRLLRGALLKMHEDPEGRIALREFGAVRFIPNSEKDYEPVFDMAEGAGIDLEAYDYVNR